MKITSKSTQKGQITIYIMVKRSEKISKRQLKKISKIYSGLEIDWIDETIEFDDETLYTFYMI